MNRIAIIGISGTGKSTLARNLGARTGLPVHHVDTVLWLPNWVEQTRELALEQNNRIVQQEQWIIEGWIEPDEVNRLDYADMVIDLDYPGWICAFRSWKRMKAPAQRPELPENCKDRFNLKTISKIFWKKERPIIEATLALARIRTYKKFKSPSALRRWLKGTSL